jgi:hypothetical protein
VLAAAISESWANLVERQIDLDHTEVLLLLRKITIADVAKEGPASPFHECMAIAAAETVNAIEVHMLGHAPCCNELLSCSLMAC